MTAKFRFYSFFAFLFISLTLFCAYAQNVKKPSSDGFSSGEAIIREVGMKIKAPKGWTIFSPDITAQKLSSIEQQETGKTGKNPKDKKSKQISDNYTDYRKSASGMNEAMKSGQETGIPTSSMFTATQKKDNYLLSVTGRCLNTKELPGITKPGEYLTGVTGSLDKKKYNVKNFKTKIGGKEFEAVSMTLTLKKEGKPPETKNCTYYCSFIKGYALILTATTPAGKEAELDAFLKTVSFE
ncbi:MAG: hypothetical protein LWY06_16150 [Firmicutes bacterium]|nr:hypothetical protein [Bacillota bacterium]